MEPPRPVAPRKYGPCGRIYRSRRLGSYDRVGGSWCSRRFGVLTVALTHWLSPTRRHEIDDAGRVVWLELFFDLIYVAALIQLGDRLSDDVSWGGVARFAGAFVVLWWTWTGTTALVNRFAVDDVPHRLLTFVQMFAIGNLAVLAASPEVDDRTTWFVVAYIAARVPLFAMYWRVRQRIDAARQLVDLYSAVFGISLVVWAASLLLDPSVRWLAWAVALVIEFSAPVIGVRRRIGPSTHNDHFQERYALFTIIVLGETFVKTLSELTEIGVSARTQVFGGLLFVILVALWWTYFDDVAESDLAPRSPLARSLAVNRLIWVYVHLPLAMGLTAFGVAAKKVIGVESFGDALRDTYSWLLVAALAISLICTAVLDAVTISPHFGVRTSAQVTLRLASAALVLLAGALLATGSVDAIVGVGAIAAVVTGQIGAEVVVAARADRRVEAAIDEHRAGAGCVHLEEADEPGRAPGDELTCRTCDERGMAWVQLRLCLDCGHVGCCDDSPGRHAAGHHIDSGHPTIATLESGDSWAYCFAHDSTDPTWWDRHRPLPTGDRGRR